MMKTILEYLSEDLSLDARVRRDRNFHQLEEYFGSPLPNDIQEQFVGGLDFNEIIEESLKTHNTDKLIKKLKEKFGELIGIQDDKTGTTRSFIVEISSFQIKQFKEDIENLLDFFNYYITFKEFLPEDRKVLLYIEPLYTTKCTDFVKNDCNGIVYHITHKENKDIILKNGIRIKTGKTPKENRDTFINYRTFPRKIFLTAFKRNKESIIIDKIRDIIKELCGKTDVDFSKFVVFKIDLRGIDMDFYKDDGMKSDNCFYTFASIPANFIKKVIEL